MGKVFITDEVNDMYTADVTRGGKLKVEQGAANHYRATSAQALISGEIVASAGCYLKSIIFGSAPATATNFWIWDHGAGTAGGISAFGTSGDNVVAMLGLEPSAGAVSADFLNFPKTLPIDVYCTSGITVGIGMSAGDSVGRIGCLKNVTVVYQL